MNALNKLTAILVIILAVWMITDAYFAPKSIAGVTKYIVGTHMILDELVESKNEAFCYKPREKFGYYYACGVAPIDGGKDISFTVVVFGTHGEAELMSPGAIFHKVLVSQPGNIRVANPSQVVRAIQPLYRISKIVPQKGKGEIL